MLKTTMAKSNDQLNHITISHDHAIIPLNIKLYSFFLIYSFLSKSFQFMKSYYPYNVGSINSVNHQLMTTTTSFTHQFLTASYDEGTMSYKLNTKL